MAILAEENEIEMVVTWVCNWHCDYCSVDTHNRPPLSFEEVLSKIDKVIPGYNVTISGGEPGTLKRVELETIISKLEEKQCRLRINTNGLFLKRYPDLVSRFEKVIYHCSENLQDEVIINQSATNIDYLIIVTDKNFNLLEDFLNKYPSIQFSLVASTMPLGIKGTILSPRLKHQMLSKFYKRMTQDSIKRVFKEKDFDAITYL